MVEMKGREEYMEWSRERGRTDGGMGDGRTVGGVGRRKRKFDDAGG